MANAKATGGKRPSVGKESLTTTPNQPSYQITPTPPQQGQNPMNYSQTYVREWKITDSNLKERVQEIETIIKSLMGRDITEICRNPKQYKHAVT